MSTNYINIGTINHKNRNLTINVPAGTNTADLIRAFMSDKAEDVPFSSVKSESHSEKEPRLKQLFDDPKRTEEESNRFLNFLSDHNISSRLIDSSQDNPSSKVILNTEKQPWIITSLCQNAA